MELLLKTHDGKTAVAGAYTDEPPPLVEWWDEQRGNRIQRLFVLQHDNVYAEEQAVTATVFRVEEREEAANGH